MKSNTFTTKFTTIILSDIHLSDAEPEYPNRPLWKKFRQKQFFIDKYFEQFLEKIKNDYDGPLELVLNGDIFDFDSVMSVPENNEFKYSTLEQNRGLNSEVEKSVFKIQRILEDHSLWLECLAKFASEDNRLVFLRTQNHI